MNLFNNTIITCANSPYYASLLTLISSIHKYSFNIVDKIFVYNLGLDVQEIAHLNSIKNLTVLNFSDNDKNSHPKFMEPKSYVYKTHCLYTSKQFGNNILWIDAGAMFLKSCEVIFNTINSEHIFLVGDIHKNKDYTHSECSRIMNATDTELNSHQIWAGMVGYKANGTFDHMITKAYEYAMIPGCLDGNQENHRHDQSILSILASRYGAPMHDIDTYGYWTDINRNLQKANDLGSVVFAHRRGHSDTKDIIYND
jgi:hypothetical protein